MDSEQKIISRALRRFWTGNAKRGAYIGDRKYANHIYARAERQENFARVGFWWTTGNGEYLFVLEKDKPKLSSRDPETSVYLFRVQRDNIQDL